MARIVIVFVSLISFVLTAENVSAAKNKLYVQLSIQEKGEERIAFSLDGAELVRGNYESQYTAYHPDKGNIPDYTLEAYTTEGERKVLSGVFSLRSSLSIFWDGKESGGVVKLKESTIETVVPYDMSKPVRYIRINNKGTKTPFLQVFLKSQ